MKILNKKGFTLVELLATIVILGIISVIAIISIDAMLDESKRVECEAIVTNLKDATKEYVSDRRYDASFNNPSFLQIKLLVNGGYFSNKINNPFTNDSLSVYDFGDYQLELIYKNNELIDVDVSYVIDCDTKDFFP